MTNNSSNKLLINLTNNSSNKLLINLTKNLFTKLLITKTNNTFLKFLIHLNPCTPLPPSAAIATSDFCCHFNHKHLIRSVIFLFKMYGCCATGRVSMVGRNLSHKNIGKNCQKHVKKIYMKVSIFYRLCTTKVNKVNKKALY